jgi:hypothetical protein
MRISPQRVLGLIGLLLLAVVARAEAQPAVPDCSADPQCLSLYDRARQESEGGNLAEAQRFYKLAYEVKADPRLLFSIARVLHKGSRPQEAAIFYQQFIDSPLDDAEQKRKAQQYLDQLRSPQPSPPLPPTPPPQIATPAPAATPTKIPEDTQSPKPGRPRWRLIVGGVTIGAGLLLTGFGASALVANGRCIDAPIFPAQTCENVITTGGIGGALVGVGAAAVVGGVVLLAWPGK